MANSPKPRSRTRWRESSTNDSRGRKRPHFGGTSPFQYLCACVERRTSCGHIIHEKGTAIRKIAQVPPVAPEPRAFGSETECSAYIPVTPRCWQVNLWSGVAHALQEEANGKIEITGKFSGLVETALALATRVQRYGDDPVHTCQHIAAMFAHEPGEPSRDRLTPFVLQRMNDLP